MESHDLDAKVTVRLEAIKAGGRQLVTLARQRVSEVLDALDDGDFRLTLEGLHAAEAAIAPLANAQAYLAIASDAVLVAARDLRDGMVLVDVGEIADVSVHDCTAERCTGHVKFKIGNHDAEYGGDAELYVTRESCQQE